ncbi:MAG: hypothetical protein ACTHKQ_21435 [Mesorhizobium sp.]
MNEYTAQTLTIDLAAVIIALAGNLLDPEDLMQLTTNPPEHEEDLMDFIDRHDIDILCHVLKVVKELTKGLSPTHLHALRRSIVELAG